MVRPGAKFFYTGHGMYLDAVWEAFQCRRILVLVHVDDVFDTRHVSEHSLRHRE